MFGLEGVIIVVEDIVVASDLLGKMRGSSLNYGRGSGVGRLEEKLGRRDNPQFMTKWSEALLQQA
jgi:hypothetical protein